jgi:hypothetical protein
MHSTRKFGIARPGVGAASTLNHTLGVEGRAEHELQVVNDDVLHAQLVRRVLHRVQNLQLVTGYKTCFWGYFRLKMGAKARAFCTDWGF